MVQLMVSVCSNGFAWTIHLHLPNSKIISDSLEVVFWRINLRKPNLFIHTCQLLGPNLKDLLSFWTGFDLLPAAGAILHLNVDESKDCNLLPESRNLLLLVGSAML